MQDTEKKITEIINSNFPNGVRDDFIDTNKILRIYLANYTDENISRDTISKVIHENGIRSSGRFYFLSESDSQNILQLIEEILDEYSIAYYAIIHEKHANFFSRLHIFSPDVLKKFLIKIADENFYFDDFCSVCRSTRLEYEVAKIFVSSNKFLSLDDLQELLPYVPSEKILAVLSNAKKYLAMNNGKFIPVSKIPFDIDEILAAKRQIISRIDMNGYATPDDYILSSNFALNPELNEKDLRNIIYEKFFAADFTRRGKRFFKKGHIVNVKNSTVAVDSVRKFISEQDELSEEKLFAFSKNFGKSQHFALCTAHEMMIRVKKNLFVKDGLITFDVDGIDAALMPFVQGKIISLRSVTSFTGFPPVEIYLWNLFLLESFLRKYSRRYVYNAPDVNSANCGAIYPNSMKFENYLDVQAAVIIQENIPLEKSAVEEFLIGQGFRVKRIDKVNERIIARAQEILHQ